MTNADITRLRHSVRNLLSIINDEMRYCGMKVEKGSPSGQMIALAKRVLVETRPEDMSQDQKDIEEVQAGIAA